jgi:hypothetical protein
MTDTKQSNGRPWTLMVGATTGFNEGMGSNEQPYLNFRADIETSRGVKNRFVSVFNTLRFPTLIDDVKQALAAGAAKLTVRFDYDKGETVKVLGVGYVDFRKSADGTPPTDGAPTEAQSAELPLETPVADATPVETVVAEEPAPEPVVETPVEEPVAQADPMEGVVVEMKKPRRRRKAA